MQGGCRRRGHLHEERCRCADGKRDIVSPGGEVSGGESLGLKVLAYLNGQVCHGKAEKYIGNAIPRPGACGRESDGINIVHQEVCCMEGAGEDPAKVGAGSTKESGPLRCARHIVKVTGLNL